MTVVLVMAQGQQQRIGHLLGIEGRPSFKQLLPLYGTETIFSRICRLFREYGAPAVHAVVHAHREWEQMCETLKVPYTVQEDPGPSILDGIYNVRHLWRSRTIIALGDVVYSKDTVRRMVVGRGFQVYERPGRNTTTEKPFSERFGISFGREHHETLLGVLEDRTFRRHQDAKLNDLKWRLAGVVDVVDVFDYTDDVDTEDGFFKYLPILRDAAFRDS